MRIVWPVLTGNVDITTIEHVMVSFHLTMPLRNHQEVSELHKKLNHFESQLEGTPHDWLRNSQTTALNLNESFLQRILHRKFYHYTIQVLQKLKPLDQVELQQFREKMIEKIYNNPSFTAGNERLWDSLKLTVRFAVLIRIVNGPYCFVDESYTTTTVRSARYVNIFKIFVSE